MDKSFSIKIDLFQMLVSLSEVMDLVSREMVDHHKQVSFLAYSLGKMLDLPSDSLKELAMAGAMHDVGGLSLQDRLDSMQFDVAHPEKHTEPGYLLLSTFKPFSKIAQCIRYHHVHWNDGEGEEDKGEIVPLEGHILHLADQIAVLIDRDKEILAQVPDIVDRIDSQSGKMFVPELVDAFLDLGSRDSFWFDLTSPSVCNIIAKQQAFGSLEMNEEDFLEMAVLFRRIIDFRSRFTVTHSSGVSVVAEYMARKAGFSQKECLEMKIAGHLHDIGKLSVPTEILEKKTSLTWHDFTYLRKHPYLSFQVLQTIDGFDRISRWAGMHHERIDGSGYPFRAKGDDLCFGSRLMAVADIFTAITEVRPYRTSLSGRTALKILQSLVDNKKLDGDAFALIRDEIAEINEIRNQAQLASYKESKAFMKAIGQDAESIPLPTL